MNLIKIDTIIIFGPGHISQDSNLGNQALQTSALHTQLEPFPKKSCLNLISFSFTFFNFVDFGFVFWKFFIFYIFSETFLYKLEKNSSKSFTPSFNQKTCLPDSLLQNKNLSPPKQTPTSKQAIKTLEFKIDQGDLFQ